MIKTTKGAHEKAPQRLKEENQNEKQAHDERRHSRSDGWFSGSLRRFHYRQQPLLTAPLLPPHLYRSAFTNFHMGYSCALAWILVVIIGLAIAILFKTQNAWVHYEAE